MASLSAEELAAYASIAHFADGESIRKHVRVEVGYQPHVGRFWFDVFAISELGKYIVHDVRERQGEVVFDLKCE